ncbi:MAG: serine/threonine-protein kinase [Gloeotrichia echinulata IR180]|jgi:serine/threonine protein kinase
MNNQLLDARYRILTVLNVGEVAQTYLVEDASLPNSKFVLKQLHPASNNPQALKILRCLFADEVKILELLGQEHDQIQKLVAHFEENEEFYLVQEFIPGNPLTEEILQGIPLSEDEVINLLSEILEVLVFVHSREVIHQDIKPANMIRRESDKKLVLIDFGTVKEIVTTIVGNLEYIPVEQLHGKSQYNSDIYALGILAIAALIGLTPNEIAILPSHKNVLTGEILWRYQIPQVNTELAKILDKMIRFDYRKRYQSAREVLNDLKKLKNHEYEPQSRNQKKIRIVLTGIVSCIAVSVATWFFLAHNSVNNPLQLYKQGNDFNKVIKIHPDSAK